MRVGARGVESQREEGGQGGGVEGVRRYNSGQESSSSFSSFLCSHACFTYKERRRQAGSKLLLQFSSRDASSGGLLVARVMFLDSEPCQSLDPLLSCALLTLPTRRAGMFYGVQAAAHPSSSFIPMSS